jgi:hypothetical protein
MNFWKIISTARNMARALSAKSLMKYQTVLIIAEIVVLAGNIAGGIKHEQIFQNIWWR